MCDNTVTVTVLWKLHGAMSNAAANQLDVFRMHEEKSCQISSQFNLKRWALGFLEERCPNQKNNKKNKNKNKISGDMRSVPDQINYYSERGK